MPPKPTALDKHVEAVRRQYGSRVGARPEGPPVVVSTGSLTVDWALREDGWRGGRIHEIVGPPDSGKSTLMIYSAIELQLAYPGMFTAYVDMEGTFDYDWAESLGLDTSPRRWLHLYPNDSEDAANMARMQCQSGLCAGVIVDSVGGMESRKALSKDAELVQVGANAQVITRMVKALATLARQNNVTVLLVNQPRAPVGSVGGDVSAGPKAMQHATTTKLQMSRAGGDDTVHKLKFGHEEEIVSVKIRARVARSKIVPVGRTAQFWINNRPTKEYGAPGIWRADEYADQGIQLDVIGQSGGWYTLPGGIIVNGREKVRERLQEEPALLEQVRKAVLHAS